MAPKPAAESTPTTVKPTIKKETVRIEVPAARPTPQATIKLQAPPPPIKPAATAATRAIVPAPVPTISTTTEEVETEPAAHDSLLTYAAGGVLLFAVVNFAFQLMTYLSNN